MFRNKISPLSLSSVASVCLTDVATVEAVLREITTSIGELAKEGKTLRLNFKVGYFNVSNQLIQWQHSRELLRRHRVSQSIDGNSVADSQQSEKPSSMVACSVITPSVARHSRATSTDYRNFHVSNPNPQASATKFLGPRDTQSKSMHSSNGFGSPSKDAELIRFGKRIHFGNKVTNDELL